ncbi:MAG: host attachment protein [Chlamydiota bacterium]
MKECWLIVANSSKAKIYKVETVHSLKKIHTFLHPESRLYQADLVSDRIKANFDHQGVGSEHHDTESKEPPKKQEAIKFARQINSYLLDALQDDNIERLYISANAQFLGLLRNELNPNVAKLIYQDVDKDLTNANEKEIIDHFRLFL